LLKLTHTLFSFIFGAILRPNFAFFIFILRFFRVTLFPFCEWKINEPPLWCVERAFSVVFFYLFYYVLFCCVLYFNRLCALLLCLILLLLFIALVLSASRKEKLKSINCTINLKEGVVRAKIFGNLYLEI
jgi:hypothetical protein